MKESELRMLIRVILKEARTIIDEESSTFSAGGAVDIPAAFSNNADTKKKKKKIVKKKKKFIPDTTFEPYAKPKKKTLKEADIPVSFAEVRRRKWQAEEKRKMAEAEAAEKVRLAAIGAEKLPIPTIK